MPTEKQYQSEVKEIMHTKPSWILRHGNMIVLGVMITVLTYAALVYYPDAILTELTLETAGDSEVIIADEENKGISTFLVREGEHVYKGTPLLVWNRGDNTDYHTAIVFEEHLLSQLRKASPGQAPFSMDFLRLDTTTLGELKPYYLRIRVQGQAKKPVNDLVKNALQAVREWKMNSVAYAGVEGTARMNYILPKAKSAVELGAPVMYIEQEPAEYLGVGYIDRTQFSKVKPGQKAIIQIHELGQETIHGEVIRIAPLARELRHEVVFKITGTPSRLINASFTGTARILTEDKSLLQKIVAY